MPEDERPEDGMPDDALAAAEYERQKKNANAKQRIMDEEATKAAKLAAVPEQQSANEEIARQRSWRESVAAQRAEEERIQREAAIENSARVADNKIEEEEHA